MLKLFKLFILKREKKELKLISLLKWNFFILRNFLFQKQVFQLIGEFLSCSMNCDFLHKCPIFRIYNAFLQLKILFFKRSRAFPLCSDPLPKKYSNRNENVS